MTIHVFTTGGTIDKIYFDAKSEFHTGDPQVPRLFEEGNCTQAYELTEVFRKDSLEVSDSDRDQLAKAIHESPHTHIIVTHGTDTMTTTAAVVAEQNQDKTIVFLGAMQPARMRLTDAPFNLGFATAAVQLLPKGVYVAMNGHVFPYNQVKKNLEKGVFENK